MSDTNLNSIVARIKRFLSNTVVSGTYSDTELEYYAQDALAFIEQDYPSFDTYTITITSGISPTPTSTDSVLISLKAASLAYDAVVLESLGDAIMVKAGAIQLDTTRSLRYKGLAGNNLALQYQKMIDSLNINEINTSGGTRIDNYKMTDNDVEDDESLW